MKTFRSSRRGMTLSELLIVVAIAGIMFALAVPKVAVARDGAARRAVRQELTAAFAATRAAALQKGRTATLTLTSVTALVQVPSGINGTVVTVYGPMRFDNTLSATIQALNGAPTSVTYNARGMLTPAGDGTLMYRMTVGTLSDTLCVSAAGIILPKGCQL